MSADQTDGDHDKTIARIHRLALGLLTRRDHSPQELKQKLAKKGFALEDITTVLATLESAGLINLSRLAENYTHYRKSKGYGPRRIAMELQAKGIPEATIAEQIEITDNAWFTEIRTLWQKHFKGRQPKDARERARQLRFLFNRGYTQDQIKTVLSGDREIDTLPE